MAEFDGNDIDRRLRALVEIAASQSASIAELERSTHAQGENIQVMLQAVLRQGEQILHQGEQIAEVRASLQALERTVMEHGRHIDQQIDAIFRLAKGGDDHERRIDRLEKRFPDQGDDLVE